MSRFGDGDYELDFANQDAFWRANLERALAGKRGRKALGEMREALRALPEKRLIEGALCTVGGAERPDLRERHDSYGDTRFEVSAKIESDGEGVCAIGAFLWYRKVKAGADPQAAFDALPTLLDIDSDIYETALAGQAVGLAYPLAYHLAYKNDESFGGMTPEQRYDAFMHWLDEQLGDVPS